jgi:hypothetical protein
MSVSEVFKEFKTHFDFREDMVSCYYIVTNAREGDQGYIVIIKILCHYYKIYFYISNILLHCWFKLLWLKQSRKPYEIV